MAELRQTEEYARYMELIGWRAGKISSVFWYSKRIPLLGSFVKIQRPKALLEADDIAEIVSETRSFAVVIEPLTEKHLTHYENIGFKKIKSPSLPSKTLLFNLKKSEKKLLSDMHHKTRYNSRLAVRRGVEVKKTDDIKRFADFWHKCARGRGMLLSMKKEITAIHEAFGEGSELLFAFKKDKLLAGVMILSTKHRAHYMFAASTRYGNKQFAPTLLVWEAMKRSKKRGLDEFDFEGIYDKRFPIKSWKGFTRFKKGFGGKSVEYPSAVRRYFFPFAKISK
ncbi:MAG: peptidoglycan bridge formation glycyltransferase FemA/FemB family protein [Candidatus Woesebacteria bacterium]